MPPADVAGRREMVAAAIELAELDVIGDERGIWLAIDQAERTGSLRDLCATQAALLGQLAAECAEQLGIPAQAIMARMRSRWIP